LTEAVFQPRDSYDEKTRVEALLFTKDRYHMKVRYADGTAAMYDCEITDQHNTRGELQFSRIDAGMREVKKLFSSVVVRTRNDLDASNIIEVRANDTLLGIANDNKSNQFWLPHTFGAKESVDLKIRLIAGAAGNAPEVDSLAIRYVPIGPQKHVWSFSIKAENNIRCLDETNDARTGQQIADALWLLAITQRPVAFTDIDGVQYVVMITDAILKAPVADKPAPQGKGPEYQIVVEMVEY